MLNDTIETINSIAYAMAEQIEGYDIELVSMAEETFKEALKDSLILDDPEYDFEDQKAMINEALELAAETYERESHDYAWEAADGDSRAIYTNKAVEFYMDNMDRVEEALDSIGRDGYSSISSAICAGVAMVIADDIREEMYSIADEMRAMNVEDLI